MESGEYYCSAINLATLPPFKLLCRFSNNEVIPVHYHKRWDALYKFNNRNIVYDVKNVSPSYRPYYSRRVDNIIVCGALCI